MRIARAQQRYGEICLRQGVRRLPGGNRPKCFRRLSVAAHGGQSTTEQLQGVQILRSGPEETMGRVGGRDRADGELQLGKRPQARRVVRLVTEQFVEQYEGAGAVARGQPSLSRRQ